MESLLRDVHFGLRMIVRAPGLTAAVVLLLGLGVGATTAVFTVVDRVMLRPLPYPHADRLVSIWETDPPVSQSPASAPDYLDWKAQSESFDAMAAYGFVALTFTGDGDPERLWAQRVSGEFFSLLGATPGAGRSFLPDDAQEGHDAVVVLSHALWARRYHADPSVVGRQIILSGRSHTVIGVMPRGFRAPPSFSEEAAWVPLVFSKSDLEERGSHSFPVLARLKADHTLESARAEMESFALAFAQQYPETHRTRGVRVERLQQTLVAQARSSWMVLLAAVATLLLIACANIASLLLVRATVRQTEVAVRLALGASRGALVRQFLVESALLSLVGGGAGLLLALWLTDLIAAGLPNRLRQMTEISVDARVCAVALFVSLLTALVFGLVPALTTANAEVAMVLRQCGNRSGTGRRPIRVRNALVVTEIALSLVLTVGATLLAETYLRLRQVDLGFDPHDVVAMDVSVSEPSDPGEPDTSAGSSGALVFFESVLSRIEALPGVQAAGLVNFLPLDGSNTNGDFSLEGIDLIGEGHPVSEYLVVSPGYFTALGQSVREGRAFTPADVHSSEPVAIINETMARRYWSKESSLGKRIKLGWGDEPYRTIVGVVADVRRFAIGQPAVPETYLPFAQHPITGASLVVRTPGDPLPIVASIRRELSALDSRQAVADVRPMERIVELTVLDQRFSTALLGVFAILALALATIGLYGVVSYQVKQRAHEIGVRIALGARETDIFRLIVGAGAKLAAAGIAVGLFAAYVAAEFLAGSVYGVGEVNPVSLGLAAGLLIGVALAASYLPARRAARVDPMSALRME